MSLVGEEGWVTGGRQYQAVIFDQDGTLINTFIPAMHAYSVAVCREITLTELEPVATEAEDDVFHDALAEEVARIEPCPGIVDLLVAGALIRPHHRTTWQAGGP